MTIDEVFFRGQWVGGVSVAALTGVGGGEGSEGLQLGFGL
jgi:hypothetical protein